MIVITSIVQLGEVVISVIVQVVKLMTHIDNSISVLTSELLFNLCKHNVNRMIKYTGSNMLFNTSRQVVICYLTLQDR